MAKWIQEATEKMRKKGTLGSFGKTTRKKVAAAKKHGGLEKKRAVWAENLKKSRHKRKKKGRSSGRR